MSVRKKQGLAKSIVIAIALMLVVVLLTGVLSSKTSSNTSSYNDDFSSNGALDQFCFIAFSLGDHASGFVPTSVFRSSGYVYTFEEWDQCVYTDDPNAEFLGWSATDGDISATYVAGDTLTLTGAVTVYPVFSLPTYTVSFALGQFASGAVPSTVNVVSGNVYSFAAWSGIASTGDGVRQFLGWSTFDGVTSPLYTAGDDLTVRRNLTLYPVFSIPSYTVSFALGQYATGTVPASFSVTTGSTCVFSAWSGASYSGEVRQFLGWSVTDGATSATYEAGDTLTVTADVTLYPAFAVPLYTVSFSLGQYATGTVPASSSVLSGGTYTFSAWSGASYSGGACEFLGWSTTDGAISATYESGDTLTVRGNVTLYPAFDVPSYTVTFSLGEYATGTVPASATLRLGSSYVFAPCTSVICEGQEDAEFLGWSATDGTTSATYEAGDSLTVSANLTLYPAFNLPYFTITFELGQYATGTVPASVSHIGGREYTFPACSTVSYIGEEREFLGWQSESLMSYYSPGDTWIVIGDTTFYPVFAVPTYTITFNRGQYATGTVRAPVSISSGDSYRFNSSESLTYIGESREFLGWSTTDGSSSADYVKGRSYTIRQNLSLYPAFALPTYTVFFSLGEHATGTVPASSTVSSGSTYTFSAWSGASYSGEVREFLGWSATDGATSATYAAGDTLTVTGNVTLYPAFAVPTYTVSFSLGQHATGTVPASSTVSSGSTYTFSAWSGASYSGEVREFLGWSATDGATSATYAAGDTLTVTGNVTLYPAFEEPVSVNDYYFTLVNNTDSNISVFGCLVSAHGSYEWSSYSSFSGSVIYEGPVYFEGTYQGVIYSCELMIFMHKLKSPSDGRTWSFEYGDHGTITFSPSETPPVSDR